MCLLWYANRIVRFEFDTDMIDTLYHLFVKNEWMEADCYIKAPDAILGYFGIDATVKRESARYFCGPKEFEILKFMVGTVHGGTWNHFVAGDGAGHTTYDPYGMSRAVREGMLMNKRIFRLL